MALLSVCAISVKAEEASCVVTAVCDMDNKSDGKAPDNTGNETDIDGHRKDNGNFDSEKHSGSLSDSKNTYNSLPAYLPVIDMEAIPTYVINETHDNSEDTVTDKSNIGKLPNRNGIINSADTTELIRYNLVYIKDADKVIEKKVYSFFIEEMDK